MKLKAYKDKLSRYHFIFEILTKINSTLSYSLRGMKNQHPTSFCRCQKQVAYVNNTRPFLSIDAYTAGAYTAGDNALHQKAV